MAKEKKRREEKQREEKREDEREEEEKRREDEGDDGRAEREGRKQAATVREAMRGRLLGAEVHSARDGSEVVSCGRAPSVGMWRL